jgi:hypothetical protein
MIVDPEKNTAEIYLLNNKQYILAPHSSGRPFNFTFTHDCSIDLLVTNIWE